jgi:hypothetical protein
MVIVVKKTKREERRIVNFMLVLQFGVCLLAVRRSGCGASAIADGFPEKVLPSQS